MLQKTGEFPLIAVVSFNPHPCLFVCLFVLKGLTEKRKGVSQYCKYSEVGSMYEIPIKYIWIILATSENK